MPHGIELVLGILLCLFVAWGHRALRREAPEPLPWWVAGWISAGIAGVLVLDADDLPHLALLAFPLGTLFPFLLLVGAVELAGRRAPGGLLLLGLGFGLLRMGLAAADQVRAAFAVALAVEPAITVAAGVIAHRALRAADAGRASRWIGPSFGLLAAAGAFHLAWLLRGDPPAPVLTTVWIVATPPLLGLQIWAASERTRLALRRARDGLEQRVAERTAELAAANEALRRSEERYRTVSALSSDFSFAFGVDRERRLRLEWITGAFRRITGVDPAALDGKGWLELLPSGTRREIERALDEAGPERLATREITIHTADGAARHLEVRALTRPGDRPGELRVLGAARDVTETRRMEAERREMELRMHESARLESLGRLSGGIAHDFNNLLSVILGNALLAVGELPAGAPARARLARIRDAADHAARLTDQMLTYAGKAPTHRRVLDVSEVVSQMLELVRAALPDPCELEVDLAPGLRVEADETQVQQIVLNLVTNASEAMHEEGGRILLRTSGLGAGPEDLAGARGTEDPAAGEYVALEVRDQGRGMDAGTRERIFDPFFTTKFTGRGMGLASVLGIVRSHGGVVTLESAPDEGTTVRILLPRVDAPGLSPEEAASSPSRAPADARVLVVDDDPGVLEIACEFLRRGGFEVVAEEGGRAGIERLRAEADRIDAVVLDLSMPGVGGEEAFLAMREIRPDLPVVLSTGFSEELASDRFRAPGAAGFLRKPFGPEELVDHVRDALAREDDPDGVPS